MALPISDTFSVGSDTALETYDSTNWPSTQGDNTSFTVYNTTPDQCRREGGAGFHLACASSSPSNADYYMEVVCKTVTATTSHAVGPVVRHDGAAKGSQNCYYSNIDGGGNYFVGEYTSGSSSTISSGSITVVTFSASTEYTVRLEFDGTSWDFLIDGSSEDSGTDSTHTSAGDPGCWCLATSAYWKSYSADHLGAATGPNLLTLLGVG